MKTYEDEGPDHMFIDLANKDKTPRASRASRVSAIHVFIPKTQSLFVRYNSQHLLKLKLCLKVLDILFLHPPSPERFWAIRTTQPREVLGHLSDGQ